MTHGEYATKLGLTFTQYQSYRVAYLQCEGYTDDGREHETLESYINAVRKPATITPDDRTPWQKGDDLPL